MDQYTYLFLGAILGAAIVLFIWMSIEEGIEKTIKSNQKVFSTSKLDKTMETIVNKIKFKISQVKRELTEEEKNEIIENCLKDDFIANK
mgnify:CR=1 FL=1